MNIDAHQHFWRYDAAQFPWMSDEMGVIKYDYMPTDLQPLIQAAGLQGSVAVQARQSLEETDWLLGLADKFESIRGVVGWVDLRAATVRDQLAPRVRQRRLVGVRHVVHDEPDDNFMLHPNFLRGLAALEEFHLVYDLLLFPRHLPVAAQVVRQFPRQRFVLDHIAKPRIKAGVVWPWDDNIRALARHENVFCKLSGMVTEADWSRWQPADFTRYLDVVVDCFGADRLMFGSDWPVCTLAGDYGAVTSLVRDYVRRLPGDAHDKIMGRNAAEFYALK